MKRARSIWLLATFGVAIGALLACSSGSDRQCTVGADCASGACNADGTCVAVASGSTDGGASLGDGGSTTGSDGSTFPIDASPLACATDGGALGHDNVPIAAGLTATFEVATNETVDTAGTDNGDGSKTWDFTVPYASDQSAIVQTLSPSGAWWAPDFTTATYASKLVQAQSTLGVFDYGANSLDLVGVVSPTSDGVTETELTYATPIPILAFPLHMAQTWSTTSNVSGKLNGVTALYSETYDSKVDAYGTVKTPYGNFAALRVGTLLTQNAGAVTKTRTYAWVTACFGTIAKATSTSMTNTGTPGENFTQTAELMRLAP